MNRCGRWAAFLLAAAAVAGCRERAAAPRKREIPLVYTTFYPTTYFAKRIGGSRVKVVCPVPAGEDPIFWMPDSDTIAAYQQAGYAALAGELDQLHESLEELSAALEDRPLLASHPAYNYLAARYGWNLTNLSLDPETLPDEETLATKQRPDGARRLSSGRTILPHFVEHAHDVGRQGRIERDRSAGFRVHEL